jgi:hypothetical protein
MNDLNALLERAAGPATATFDAQADLTRAQRALSRTRRRRRALGLAGVATAGVVGVGIDRFSGHRDVATERTLASDPTVPTTTPAAPDVTAGPYTFPALPDGWEVQGAHAQVVTIAPVGFPDQQPLSFPGKLVIGYDQNPPAGQPEQRDGRTFWVNGGGDTIVISARTRADEPAGEVTIQYPTSSGWTTDEMITFLDGVHVGPGAEPGLG